LTRRRLLKTYRVYQFIPLVAILFFIIAMWVKLASPQVHPVETPTIEITATVSPTRTPTAGAEITREYPLLPTIQGEAPTALPDEIDVGNPVPEGEDDGNMYNGYWWANEGWVAGLVTIDTQFLRLPPVSMGSAVFYAPEAMEANVIYRGLPYDKNYYAGAVAVEFCSEIGHEVWLRRPSQSEWEGPFLVTDCSRRNDLYGHIMFRDQVVEVDFNTAVRWGMAKFTTTNSRGWMAITGRLDGVLVSKNPPEQFDGNIMDLSTWFPTVVRYAKITESHHRVENYMPPSYDGTVYGSLGISNPSDKLPMWLINDQWVIFP
jgi:hypothetical protein